MRVIEVVLANMHNAGLNYRHLGKVITAIRTKLKGKTDHALEERKSYLIVECLARASKNLVRHDSFPEPSLALTLSAFFEPPLALSDPTLALTLTLFLTLT